MSNRTEDTRQFQCGWVGRNLTSVLALSDVGFAVVRACRANATTPYLPPLLIDEPAHVSSRPTSAGPVCR